MVAGGYHIVRRAVGSLRTNRELDINVLMTLAVAGAVLIGEWAEGAVVVFLFSLGEALEGYTMDQARDAIRSLMTLAPAEATVLRPCLDCAGHLGHRLPAGGVYEGGPCPWCEPHELPCRSRSWPSARRCWCGQASASPWTAWCCRPLGRQPGAYHRRKPAGGQRRWRRGLRRVDQRQRRAGGRVTRLAADNTLSRLIHMVEEAQAQKAPAQRWIDRFARVYTPAVVALAAAVAVLPPLLFGQPLLNTAKDRLAVPRADPAGDRLSLRAGHLHPGQHRQRHQRRRAPRRADQGWRPPGGLGTAAGRGLRQDRHVDPGPPGAHRSALHGP